MCTSSKSNGPGLDRLPRSRSRSSHDVLELVLLDLGARERDRQRPAVDRRRAPASSRINQGSAPTWSSWPWVSTIASMSSWLAQVGEVGQHEVDPQHLRGREHQARVDDDDAARRTRTPSCSCRSRPGRRAAGRAGWRPASVPRRHRGSQGLQHPAQLGQLRVVHLDQRQPHAAQLEPELPECRLHGRGRGWFRPAFTTASRELSVFP